MYALFVFSLGQNCVLPSIVDTRFEIVRRSGVIRAWEFGRSTPMTFSRMRINLTNVLRFILVFR